MNCPSCHKEIPANAASCSGCGFSFDDATQRLAPESPPRKSQKQSATSFDSIDDARFVPGMMLAERYRIVGLVGKGGMGEVDGRHFLSMEFIKGEELSSLLRRIGRLPQDKAIQIARQICAGLAAAHDASVLHRDLKPSNVMIDEHGNARITDFGLAGLAERFREDELAAGTPA